MSKADQAGKEVEEEMGPAEMVAPKKNYRQPKYYLRINLGNWDYRYRPVGCRGLINFTVTARAPQSN